MARQNGDTHQESYVPTKIKAAQIAQLKSKTRYTQLVPLYLVKGRSRYRS